MNIYPQFLELLSATIWSRKVEPSLFQDLDVQSWKRIVECANTQRVVALITAGVETLPSEYRPPKSIFISLLLLTEKIKDANRLINERLGDISKEYGLSGLSFVLLKGQGNSIYYPDALCRTPGDLDLFLYRDKDYQFARKWIIKNGLPYDKESDLHLGFDWRGVHIENHHHIFFFTKKKYNKTFQKIVDEVVAGNSFESVQINGVTIHVLPVELNVVYLFLHLFRHFIDSGVGLRQVCDWVLILSARHEELQKERLIKLAKHFGILNAMCALAHACIKHLGASPEIFPFLVKNDNCYSDMFMKDILQGGHFGFYKPHQMENRGLWRGRWTRYCYLLKHSVIFGYMAPSYFYRLVLYRLWNRIKLTLGEF